MSRWLTALLSLALVVMLGACDDPKASGGSHPKPNPHAGNAQNQGNAGGQAAQPAPVQGDPSAHNTQEGEVDLHLSWTSENNKKPVCEWSKNAVGQGHPCENIENPHKEGLNYIGLWEREETGKAGDVFWLSAEGFSGTKSIECEIFWKGAYHSGITNGKRCSVTLTLN